MKPSEYFLEMCSGGETMTRQSHTNTEAKILALLKVVEETPLRREKHTKPATPDMTRGWSAGDITGGERILAIALALKEKP